MLSHLTYLQNISSSFQFAQVHIITENHALVINMQEEFYHYVFEINWFRILQIWFSNDLIKLCVHANLLGRILWLITLNDF